MKQMTLRAQLADKSAVERSAIKTAAMAALPVPAPYQFACSDKTILDITVLSLGQEKGLLKVTAAAARAGKAVDLTAAKGLVVWLDIREG